MLKYFSKVLSYFQKARECRARHARNLRDYRALSKMTARELDDIGISRENIWALTIGSNKCW